jgi:16S rRNA (cytosine1402-N4)-methyltransferase
LAVVHANYANLSSVLSAAQFPAPKGIAADLGLSSPQLDASDRGFSFAHGGPLDMRFDPTSSDRTAAQMIAGSTAAELETMIRRYGEEKNARRIAEAIVSASAERPITTAEDLAAVIARVVRRRGRIHPATQTFQALRIAVNDELGTLERGIDAMFGCVSIGGRIAIVSFHSLEDRIVKRMFRRAQIDGRGVVRTPKPIIPNRAEIARNPRSRSAKLRVFERTC